MQDFVLTSLYAIMKSNKSCVRTINGGSSSIKLSLYRIEETIIQLFYGKIENCYKKETAFNFYGTITEQKESFTIVAANHDEAANFLIKWLQKKNASILLKQYVLLAKLNKKNNRLFISSIIKLNFEK